MLIDSHCHLVYDGLAERQTEVLASARSLGIAGFLNISTRQSEWNDVIAVATREPDVWASVGVHPHEADAHPMRHHHGRAPGHLLKPAHVGVGPGRPQLGVVVPDGEVGQGAQIVQLAGGRHYLKVAEANERRRHPRHNGAGLGPGVAVVKHVALDLIAAVELGLVLAAVLALVGKSRLAKLKAPERTVRTAKETVATLKGATSHTP